jgi:hypothetical protein
MVSGRGGNLTPVGMVGCRAASRVWAARRVLALDREEGREVVEGVGPDRAHR